MLSRRLFFSSPLAAALAPKTAESVPVREEVVRRMFRDPRYVCIAETDIQDSRLLRVKDRGVIPAGSRVLVIFCEDHARLYPLSEEFRTNPMAPAFRVRAGGDPPANPVHQEHGLWVWSAEPEG
jgi:hypothetical protein